MISPATSFSIAFFRKAWFSIGFMDERVLLIGGAGFLGNHLAKAFQESGFKVAILDRVEPRETHDENERFTGDLRDTHLLRAAISRYPRIVYLAHEANTAPTADRLPANFLGNIDLFLTVLEEARECQIEEFTLFSSGGAVYGQPIHLPIREDHPKNPRSPYGIAKLTMEKYLAMAAEQDGFRQIAIRPSNPYGPGQIYHAAQGIVAVAMSRIARGEPLIIRGDGSATKDYVFIEDFASACACLVTKTDASGPFNIGSGIGVPLLEVIASVEKTVGKSAVLGFEPAQSGDVSVNVLDIQKIGSATRWTPTTSLAAGLVQTWDWMEPKL